MLRAAECALRTMSYTAPNQIDDVNLASIARQARGAAKAQRDACAGCTANHADYLGVSHFDDVGSVDGDKDVAHTNLREHILWVNAS